MTYNYNIGMPPKERKRFFSYQTLYFIFLVLAILYIVSEVFLFDYSIFLGLKHNQISDSLNMASYSYNKVYLYPSLIGKICIPLGVFLCFISTVKNNLDFIKKFAIFTVVCEIMYDLYTMGKFFEFRFQSPVIVMFFGALYTYAWTRTKDKKFIKLFMTIAYLSMSVLLKADEGPIIAMIFVILNFFEPVRKNQAIFSGIVSAFGLTMVGIVPFIYFYDDTYNRKKYNDYMIFSLPIFAFLLWRLRLLLLS